MVMMRPYDPSEDLELDNTTHHDNTKHNTRSLTSHREVSIVFRACHAFRYQLVKRQRIMTVPASQSLKSDPSLSTIVPRQNEEYELPQIPTRVLTYVLANGNGETPKSAWTPLSNSDHHSPSTTPTATVFGLGGNPHPPTTDSSGLDRRASCPTFHELSVPSFVPSNLRAGHASRPRPPPAAIGHVFELPAVMHAEIRVTGTPVLPPISQLAAIDLDDNATLLQELTFQRERLNAERLAAERRVRETEESKRATDALIAELMAKDDAVVVELPADERLSTRLGAGSPAVSNSTDHPATNPPFPPNDSKGDASRRNRTGKPERYTPNLPAGPPMLHKHIASQHTAPEQKTSYNLVPEPQSRPGPSPEPHPTVKYEGKGEQPVSHWDPDYASKPYNPANRPQVGRPPPQRHVERMEERRRAEWLEAERLEAKRLDASKDEARTKDKGKQRATNPDPDYANKPYNPANRPLVGRPPPPRHLERVAEAKAKAEAAKNDQEQQHRQPPKQLERGADYVSGQDELRSVLYTGTNHVDPLRSNPGPGLGPGIANSDIGTNNTRDNGVGERYSTLKVVPLTTTSISSSSHSHTIARLQGPCHQTRRRSQEHLPPSTTTPGLHSSTSTTTTRPATSNAASARLRTHVPSPLSRTQHSDGIRPHTAAPSFSGLSTRNRPDQVTTTTKTNHSLRNRIVLELSASATDHPGQLGRDARRRKERVAQAFDSLRRGFRRSLL